MGAVGPLKNVLQALLSFLPPVPARFSSLVLVPRLHYLRAWNRLIAVRSLVSDYHNVPMRTCAILTGRNIRPDTEAEKSPNLVPRFFWLFMSQGDPGYVTGKTPSPRLLRRKLEYPPSGETNITELASEVKVKSF